MIKHRKPRKNKRRNLNRKLRVKKVLIGIPNSSILKTKCQSRVKKSLKLKKICRKRKRKVRKSSNQKSRKISLKE